MTKRERTLFVAVVAGVALRVAVLGHWLVVVLALAAALAHLCAPAGVRATIATVFGVLATVGGILSVVEVRWEGFSLLDVTGLVLLPLGLGALVSAVLALLSRRHTTWPRRFGRWALTLASIVLLALYVIAPAATALWITAKPRIPVRTFSVPHRDVTLRSSDGVELAAWYVPSKNGAGVVLVHGAGGSRDGLKRHAELLARHGYGVVLYDARGRGESGGRSNGLGWDWARDVEAAVDWFEQHGVHRIGALGLSTGAEVVVTAAAHDQRIRAVVADGLQARTTDDFAHAGASDLPYWWAAIQVVHLIRGTREPAPLDELVPLIKPRPFLIVSGARDKGDSSLDDTWARADGRAGVLWKADAQHTRALVTFPREYERRIVGLFDRALL
jgi:pimeloyl-ACP methyl ester carboxylesterase